MPRRTCPAWCQIPPWAIVPNRPITISAVMHTLLKICTSFILKPPFEPVKICFSQVLVESEEEGILDKKLVSTVLDLYRNREKYIEAMAGAGQQESIPTIMGLLNDLADK